MTAREQVRAACAFQSQGTCSRRAHGGLAPDRLYFNIDRVGNTSAASIGLAIEDAVRDGIVDGPRRVFAPAFGAGAVAGYAVMRIDPAVVTAADGDPAAPTAASELRPPYRVAA